MSFTTQSASCPGVLANSFAVMSPARTTSSVRGSVTQERTSGRPSTKRWSSRSQVLQPDPRGASLYLYDAAKHGEPHAGWDQHAPGVVCV